MRTSVIIVFAAVVTVCAAADAPIAIVSQSQDGPNPDGSYKWSWESANGIKAEEEGSLSGQGDDAALQVRGSSSYKSTDGQDISLKYTANEEGFKPEGAHLPTPPPIPELIKKALEWIEAHPSKDDQ
ncbi:endocuticle structural glycoprotein SgAbd-8 [Fopius arisanus]|uniref:Endocuticle structural glycoprotein SgAbd-8 n=2 Tax=Fopius arisanus TaxID=64838 RepID=A0A9R1TLZ0_9HYME|nr:PREDICTED: endocuticle structural glycoprotein SgAbd-8-like [Fopius arisanus]